MALLKETALALPRLVLLISKLIGDERVPTRVKLALSGLAVYLASPLDIIPDFIPVLGQLDDLTVALLFVDGVLNQVDDAVLLEHWTGEVSTLRRLQALARLVSRWVPKRLKRVLFGSAALTGRQRLREAVPAQGP